MVDVAPPFGATDARWRRLAKSAEPKARRVVEMHSEVPTFRVFTGPESESNVLRVVMADGSFQVAAGMGQSHALVSHQYRPFTDPTTNTSVLVGTRPYFKTLLSGAFTAPGRPDFTRPETSWLRRWDARTRILQGVLEALAELHDLGQYHRSGLADSNIAIRKGEAALLDWDVPVPRDTTANSLVELQSDDIIRFTHIAQRLLGSNVWDSRNDITEPRLHTAEFEWVLDYCSNVQLSEVPSARELLDVLFNDGERLHAQTTPSVIAAQAKIWAEIAECSDTDSVGAVQQAASRSASTMRRVLKLHPVTRIAVREPAVAERLLRRLCIDYARESVQTSKRYANPQDNWNSPIVALNKELGLDPASERQLLSWHSDNPDAEMLSLHRSALEAARRDVLGEIDFVHAKDVADIISVPGATATEADVAVLREWGALLGIADHGRWYYPIFQFDPKSGAVSDLILEANETLGFGDPVDSLIWWVSTRPSLKGRSYADVLFLTEGAVAIEASLADVAATSKSTP